MEVRRFGPGHRRTDGPPGSQGVTGQVIHSDDRATIAELAFQRYAMVSPHSNPSTALFIVISGGGYVQVGAERTRINHGEAVVWPPDLPHGAYTDGSEMRAIVVELGEAGSHHLLEGRAVELEAGNSTAGDTERSETQPEPAATAARGSLAQRQKLRDEYDASEGEPW
jgi:quercetin dioxygenase-like cupin family protein